MAEAGIADELPWPSEGRLAGIDFGTVRIGVAVTDPSRRWASPLDTYNRRNERLDEKYFVDLVRENSIVGMVLGLPIHCDGQESQKSLEVRSFAKWLTERTGVPVRFIDERFSSALATQLLAPAEFTRKKTKQRIDRVAALIILESFLESQRRSEESQRRGEQSSQVEAEPLDD